jgi:hypothetical protein
MANKILSFFLEIGFVLVVSNATATVYHGF